MRKLPLSSQIVILLMLLIILVSIVVGRVWTEQRILFQAEFDETFAKNQETLARTEAFKNGWAYEQQQNWMRVTRGEF